ncbi:hyaluronate lyase N-terminal domain-containing protein [Aestuariibaculum marinum]|uniref:Major tropism determinant N-terminal domain-containing protein n=1 Tax=Aestuariibaculum marinum TaxID=2683592 RepID=A0A8J6U182_9FLAO|nr:hypothetical protein [Aestuariibaculum marinum]MBD0822655.1 hypothetical protein [Aestuariibaculum marinum]
MADIIQLRRDTKDNWAAANPILAQGEPALEIDSKREKTGDGVTPYNALPYKDTGSNTSTGTTTENVYPDMVAMYADQVNQTTGKYQYVIDASGHSEIVDGFALFDKKDTNTASEADYRILTPGESEAVLTGSTYNAFTVANIDVEVAATVPTGSVRIQYENVDNKITHILFDKPFTSYLKGYSDASGTNNLTFKLINKSTNKTLIDVVTGFAYSNPGNKYYLVALDASIAVTEVSAGDVLEVDIDVSPAAAAGGVQSVTGDGVSGTATDPVLDLSSWQLKPTEGAFIDGDKTKLDSVESGATADQTGVEIKNLLFAESDTNNLTDALLSKLNGIKTGVVAEGDITGAINFDHNNVKWLEQNLTGNVTITDVNLVIDDKARGGEFVLNGFTMTFPLYWVPDTNSEDPTGAIRVRLTWDIMNIDSGTERVSYTYTVIE